MLVPTGLPGRQAVVNRAIVGYDETGRPEFAAGQH
jgi:hypothetical protein